MIKKYLDKYPNMSTHGLSKLIYRENPLHFKDVENVRTKIRYLKGVIGKKNLKKVSDKYLTPEKRLEKYNLPSNIETEYKPYKIIGNNGLIFGDAHLPFHSISAFHSMFDYTAHKDLDFIIINGDFMDCFDVSNFSKEPDVCRLKDERDIAKSFLIELARVYPKTKIYYKFGNHEKRFENYLQNKAPELWGFAEFRLEILLDLFNIGVTYIPDNLYIDVSGLAIYHGHEFRNGITSPANPARTAFLRSKDSALVAHNHQSSEHTETSINGKVITCWSVGCMCGLHPAYMPLNKWNHGFALYTREDEDFWTVQNKRIIKHRVV